MAFLDVFFGRDARQDRADDVRDEAEEALSQYHPKEVADLAFHVERCTLRWRLMRATQKQAMIRNDKKADRNFMAVLILAAYLVANSIMPAADILKMLGIG